MIRLLRRLALSGMLMAVLYLIAHLANPIGDIDVPALAPPMVLDADGWDDDGPLPGVPPQHRERRAAG